MLFRYAKKRKKPVVFISSALSSDRNPSRIFDFFAIMAAWLSVELRRYDYEMILKVPEMQGTASGEQIKFIQEMIKAKYLSELYSGIILAPFDTDKLEKDIATLIRINNKINPIPILTIDKNFREFDGKLQLERGVPAPPYIITHAETGGGLAALSLIAYYYTHIIHSKIKELRIGIMGGFPQASADRINGFNNMLSEYEANNSLKYHILYEWNGKFDRDEAKRKVDDDYNEIYGSRINAFFCCNDEMALGVRDFFNDREAAIKNNINKYKKNIDKITIDITNMKSQRNKKQEEIDKLFLEKNDDNVILKAYEDQWKWMKYVKIVGFDGIQEVIVHIKNKDNWLLNSVNVQVQEQAAEIAKWFDGCSKCKSKEIGPELIIKDLKEQYYDHD
jgi:ABC-type sugar transport system substrate-binding protein